MCSPFIDVLHKSTYTPKQMCRILIGFHIITFNLSTFMTVCKVCDISIIIFGYIKSLLHGHKKKSSKSPQKIPHEVLWNFFHPT